MMGLLQWVRRDRWPEIPASNSDFGPGNACRRVVVGGVRMQIVDLADSVLVESVRNELEHDVYRFKRIPIRAGDVVIDIGANVGMVSIYLAKRFPSCRIVAFEPIPENFRNLVLNLELNRVTNVEAQQLAVTADGRPLRMIANAGNTGGATGQLRDLTLPGHSYYNVPSITLDEVFARQGIEHCRLLKIDCEGSEHEILHACRSLGRIDYLSGEFHTNSHLAGLGYTIGRLVERCTRFIPPDKLAYTTIQMAE